MRRHGRTVTSFHFVHIVKERRIPPLRVRYCKPGAAEGSRTPKILLLRQACMPIPSPPPNPCPSLCTFGRRTRCIAKKKPGSFKGDRAVDALRRELHRARPAQTIAQIPGPHASLTEHSTQPTIACPALDVSRRKPGALSHGRRKNVSPPRAHPLGRLGVWARCRFVSA
jgi:hypothetical protein